MHLRIFFKKLKPNLYRVLFILVIWTNNQKDMLVLIIVKKDILNKVIIKNWTDLISHLYYIIFDSKDHRPGSKKFSRMIKVVNLYDNNISNGCEWQRCNPIIK